MEGTMREIKFRAWDKQDKKMIYSEKVYPSSMYKFEFDILNNFEFKLMKMIDRYNVTDDEGNDTYQEVFEAVEVDIMQHIGRKDSEGKEIYEGDIVEIDDYFGENFIGRVIYDEIDAGYWIMKGDEKKYFKMTFDLEGYLNCVVGNIYENQELLG